MERRLVVTAGAAAALVMASGARAQDKSSPAELAERFAAALTAHDMGAFALLFAEDYVNHQTSAAAGAPPPNRTPKQGTVGFFQARLTGMPDLAVSIEAIVASDDQVAASFVYEGIHGGVYMGVPPTGKRLRFTSCDIFLVRAGQFAEHWGMGDAAGIMAQLKS
jgi:steroid delta-isomerase-like uncharacterized protein